MKLGPEQSVQMPMKTVISLIIMVSLGTMGYFQIQEKLNQHDTLLQMHTKDLDQNSEFRIKYPRGELGQSSGESELFMLVEHMAGQITKMEDRMENMMSNSVNILRLQQDMEKVLSDIEKYNNLKVIGDITCDVNGSIPTTSRPSTIMDPYYYVDRTTLQEVNHHNHALAVMAVDNLPSELPKDSSKEFGDGIVNEVIPYILKKDDGRIKRATIIENGKLCSSYGYLKEYINKNI